MADFSIPPDEPAAQSAPPDSPSEKRCAGPR
jgi:hypothetical protein